MTREIKFRAYDKLSKIMREGAENNLMIVLNNPDFEIMQYTGLKDKGGNRIYEGDIVKIYSGEICKVVFPEGQGFKIDYYDKEKKEGFRKDLYSEIHFSGPSISIGKDRKVYGEEYYTKRRAEVIGNIYQNKELLK